MNKTTDIMYELCKILYNKGFVVHYLKAYSTTSCYIKLDYGLGHSIRIADHNGIDKYKYKFNLMLNNNYDIESDRLYYNINEIDKLLSDIVDNKEKQLNRLGFDYYVKMVDYKNEAESKKGFWQNAREYEVKK